MIDKSEERELSEIDEKAAQYARALVVETRDQYLVAADFLKEVKAMKARVGEIYDPHVANAHAMHKALTTARAEFLRPLDEADKIARDKCNAFLTAERRKEEQREAEERAAKMKAAEEQRLADAARIEAERGTAAALAEIDRPLVMAATEPAKAPTVAPGTGQTVTWAVEIVSMPDLLAAVIAGRVPLAAVSVSLPLLQRMAKDAGIEGIFDGVKRERKTSVRI